MKQQSSTYRFAFLILFVLAFLGYNRYQAYQRSHANVDVQTQPVNKQSSATANYQEGRNINNGIPKKAYDVWHYVREHHKPMPGYVGGREFKNLERHLDITSSDGQRIHYQEWDVNPKQEGRNRGAERLITSDEDRAWFTSNHYKSFTELK